ncbi:MAG TPA: UbiD family decarboxylase, partial [Desulfuromonadaceae bacterium]
PVATNLFGSPSRICTALEIDGLDDLSRMMEGIPHQSWEASPALSRTADLTSLSEFARFAPELVTEAPCREVVDHSPDLGWFPFLRNWSGDGRPGHDGRFITLPLVITADRDGGGANCGMYRVEPFGRDQAGIHWRATSGGAGHYRKYSEQGERMPVAIAIGGDPAVIFAASLPLPPDLDEMQLAGFLRKEPVRLTRCLTSGLLVPAEAELVMEGYLEPGETAMGGAFGNHTGFYAQPSEVPVMHITCITRRRDMIYPATVVGRPPMEDCYMAKAAERLLLPLIRRELPEIADINLPLEGIFHGCAMVAIEKRNEGHPREVMEALWSRGWLAGARLLVIVDAELGVDDLSLVAWRALNAADWRRDLVLGEARDDVPLGRLGVDATKKLSPDGKRTEEITRDPVMRRMVDER